MADIVLPGTIPGLLRKGSPAIADSSAAGVYAQHALVVGTDIDSDAVKVALLNDERFVWLVPFDLFLDLTEATGRAHATWYLAGDGATWSRVADERELGPIWLATHGPGAGALPGALARRFSAAVGETSIRRAYLCVPSLAALDLNDPRLLPDGSRWVDAEALRRVVLHVAGVTLG